MSSVAAMIGLAILAVRPAWMPHGRRFERVLKHHEQQPLQLSQANLAGLEGLCQPLRYMGCAWSSFCAPAFIP